MVLLKRMAFKGKHKIQDHWEKTIYHLEEQPYVGLQVVRITPVAGKISENCAPKPVTPVWRQCQGVF